MKSAGGVHVEALIQETLIQHTCIVFYADASTELMPKCRSSELSVHMRDRSEGAYNLSSDSVCILGISTTQVLSLGVGLPLIFRNLQTR